jgi:hypothetical protein
MIVDRITLVLAYIYLDNFQSTEGTVDSVLLMKTNKFRGGTKTLAKMSMPELGAYLENIAPITTQVRVEKDCIDQSLYELRSFNINLHNGGNRLIEYRDGSEWILKDDGSVNPAQFNEFKNYTIKLNAIKAVYDKLYLDEYILAQKDYIDCGYIQQMFSAEIAEILELYKIYKTY